MEKEKHIIGEDEYKLFRFVMDNSPDIIYIYDIIKKRNVYSNEGISKVLGYTAKEVHEMGEKLISILMHPNDFDTYLKNILPRYEIARDNEWIEHSYRMKHKNDQWRWLNSKEAIYKRSENGDPKQIFGILSDITEKKDAEKELEKAKQKAEINTNILNKAGEMAKLGGWQIDLITNTLSWSQQVYKIHEVDDDFIPTVEKAINFYEKNSLPIISKAVENAVKLDKPFNEQLKIITAKGNIKDVWAIGYVKKDSDNKPMTIYGTFQDITIQKQIEFDLLEAKEKAEESEVTFRKLFEDSADAILLIDKTGVFVECNQAALNLLKTTRKEFLFQPPVNISPEYQPNGRKSEEAALEMIELAYKNGLHRFDWTCVNAENNEFIVEVSLMPIMVRGQTMLHTTWRDITERKRMELDLIVEKQNAEDANRLKSEFIKNMSHEIRTPMNGIVGFSEMLDNDKITTEKRKYYSKIVQNSGQQLLKIIDDILEISTLETKQDKIKQEEFCLNDLLMELFSIFNLIAKQRNIPIYVKKTFNDELSYIISDKTKLNKILSNLIENALKFTNEGFIEVGYFVEDDKLNLYVKDTGTGILLKNQDIIFERFSQENGEIAEKHGGLGLGLSICKENAQLLGGKITLESEKGKGSTFYLKIPYSVSKLKNKSNSEGISDDLTKKGKNILIAEDEEINYLYIEAILQQEYEQSCILIHVRNGQEAVNHCLQKSNIDLILMDIKMPIMNGHEATSKIKEKYPNLPIIAQTAYSTESDKQLALKHGCDDFISKPIDKEKLFGLINKYLNVK